MRDLPDFTKARWLGPPIFVLFVAFAVAMFVFALDDYIDATTRTVGTGEAIRNTGLVLAAIVGIPFVIWRSYVAHKQVDIAEQGLITDRINKAVEGLGATTEVNRLGRIIGWKENGKDHLEFEWHDDRVDLPDGVALDPEVTTEWRNVSLTKPNLEVRIGAIYALERIAQDSLRDHVQIMEILCAYIRENAPARLATPFPEDWEERFAVKWDEDGIIIKTMRAQIHDWASKLTKPREDIQVALRVIGRRTTEQIAREGYYDENGVWQRYRIDLQGTCLQRADITDGRLENALLDEAQMQGTVLFNARLKGATLVSSQMQGAYLKGVRLQGACLAEAQMQGGQLEDAQMQKAFLEKAKLQETELSRAQFQAAQLAEAELDGALLDQTTMDAATNLFRVSLNGAALRQVDYTEVNLKAPQLSKVFWDGSVILPIGINRRPLHDTKLISYRFNKEWRAFQRSIGQDPENPT